MPRTPGATFAQMLDIWNGAPVDRLADGLAPGYRGHMLNLAEGERDGAMYGPRITIYREAHPGVRFQAVEQFQAGDRLVTRLSAHRVDPETGQPLTANGINISRYDADGRLTEEWAIWSPWLAGA